MPARYLKPVDHNFSNLHPRIAEDRRAFPHLKDWIGALDDTHIRASIPADMKIKYIGRTEIQLECVAIWQYVTLICISFMHQLDNLMHDTSVLYYGLEKEGHLPLSSKAWAFGIHFNYFFCELMSSMLQLTYNSLVFCVHKYYLVSVGYPVRPSYLAPYKGEVWCPWLPQRCGIKYS